MYLADRVGVEQPRYVNSLGWQPYQTAPADIKGIFGALANLASCDASHRPKSFPDKSTWPGSGADRVEEASGNERAAVFGNTSGPHRCSENASDGSEYIIDALCVLNGIVPPPCGNDAGALCGINVPTSEPPAARVRARTNPNPSMPIQRVPVPPAAALGRQAS